MASGEGVSHRGRAPSCLPHHGPRLQAEAAKEPQPDLHIRGDTAVRYEQVVTAMAAAQRAGVRKIGFVTDPQQ